jgi:outer membrane protein insertion porin family
MELDRELQIAGLEGWAPRQTWLDAVRNPSIWRDFRLTGATWLGALGVAGVVVLGPVNARGQATPAGSPAGVPAGVTGGASPGQAGLTPKTPTAVPQAATGVTPGPGANSAGGQLGDTVGPTVGPLSSGLGQYKGLRVTAIRFEGVSFSQGDPLVSGLAQQADQPLDPLKVEESTRRLFATGRYRNIGVRLVREGDAVTLIFSGVPRYYVGRVVIDGVQDGRLTSLLEYGTQLNPGTAFSPSQIETATEDVRQVLIQNGYYQPTISVATQREDANQQVNVTYTVAIGPQARVGNVVLTGNDPGITLEKFRKKAKLKRKSKVGRETTSNALSNLRAVYQKEDHLEATVTLQKSTYDPANKTLNYQFQADQGPIVKVVVEGAKISKSRLHLLVPVFEEGTVDNDLLNEGRFKMQDYMQQSGYFDAKVSVKVLGAGTGTQTVLFAVDKGVKHKVVSVDIKGAKYFSADYLSSRLQTQKSSLYLKAGRYSEEVMKADVSDLEALYRANGFSNAKVTSSAKDVTTAKGKELKIAEIAVTFTIDQGKQQEFGPVGFTGVDPGRRQALLGLTNARAGQPFSLITLSGDRDEILSYYLSNGFDQAKVEVKQTVAPADKSKTDISFNVTEGKQVFIGKVLESGIHFTRPITVNQQVTVHAGEPLDQSALLETQRNLYNLALFNEVVAAVQNPAGDAQQKNVLVQITEAKRWDVTYGFGFEAQTGIPSRGLYTTAQGTTAAQQGKAGVSPRVSLDVSRINLLGTDDSLTLHTTYGLLEEVATLSFQNPHLFGNPKFSGQISGGYTNVQDITTFAATTLQGDFRVTHKPTKKDTLIYDFQYRRVAVDPNSLEISSDLVPLLSQPVRVGGPEITWFHDTRTPSPLDATKGRYLSVTEFLASSKFGSQTDFNRTDASYSTYYAFGKHQYVFARNTRFGFINSYGANPNIGNAVCVGTLLNTNPSCNAVPLPERLYAGGATSHRGFGINDAGPRDLQTGYPVGGSAVFINTFELRMPAPTLPYVGNSVSFVIFHDMGNVFQHIGDTFPSFLRFHQPNEQTCENDTPASGVGTCDFRYFSHAVGLGARYKTPVGPIRLDLSYNLNPTKYPVLPEPISGVLNSPFVGNSGHFNFFFSIGQSF